MTADEVYGINPALRCWLEAHRMPYVLAVRCTESLQDAVSTTGQAAQLAARVPGARWLTINAADGAKGRRWYAWTRIALDATGAPAGWGRWLLVRRNRSTGELAFYLDAGPAGLSLAALAKVAGCRWKVEESFQASKGPCGLDAHPGPPLALLVPVGDPGHARLRLPGRSRGHRARPASPLPGLIGLTCNEIAHLFATLVIQPTDDRRHRLRWSWWHRRHQARARASHYRRQAALQP